MARWQYLLVSLTVKTHLREVFYSYYCGLFFNLFFPSFVAGDVFKGFSLSYRHGDTKKVAASVLLSRYSGIVALTLSALLSFWLGSNIIKKDQIVASLLVLCVLVVIFSLIIFSRSFFMLLLIFFKKGSILKERIISFHDQLYYFRQNPQLFLGSLCYSFPIQLLNSLGFFIAAKAFNIDINVFYYLIIIPIVMVISIVPITISGIGIREASMVYYFALIGVDKSISLSISLLNLVFIVFSGIVGGVIYIGIYHSWLQPGSK